PEFYAAGGRYRIRVYNGAGYEETHDDVLIGTLQGQDANAYTGPGFTWSPEDQTSAPPSEGCIRFDDADVSLTEHLFIHATALSSTDATDQVLGLDPGSKSIPNRVLLTLADGREVAWDVVGVTDEGDYLDVEVDDASYVGPAGPVAVAPSGFITLSREIS